MSETWSNLSNAWTKQTQVWQANALELQHQAQMLQAKLMGGSGAGGLGDGSTFASRPDQMKTRPSEAGLTSVQQLENQSRKAAGVGELLKVDMDKLGDKIKDKLKWQTSLRWMVYELANREKVSEGCRQEFLKECYQHIKRELMHKNVTKRHKAVEKARYLWMIGYDMSTVCSLMVIEQMSLSGWHKWNGYQAAMCMFMHHDDLISTVSNLVKADLRQAPGGQEVIGWQWDGTTLTTKSITASGKGMTVSMMAAGAGAGTGTGGAAGEKHAGPQSWLAMRLACAATSILGGNAALAATVEDDVLMLLGHPCIDIRARAVLAVYRCMLTLPRVQDRGLERIMEIAREAREITMQLASVSVLCELVSRRPKQFGSRLVPFLYDLLSYDGDDGKNNKRKLVNWIKLKILRAIALAVQSEPSLANLPDTEKTLLDIITLPSHNSISLIIEGLMAVGTALHGVGGLARITLQRIHELFNDKRWKSDLSVMTLLNAVLLELNAVHPDLVEELGMGDMARSAQVDGNTVSIVRVEADDGGGGGGHDGESSLAPAGVGEEDDSEIFEGLDVNRGEVGAASSNGEGGIEVNGKGGGEGGETSRSSGNQGVKKPVEASSRWAMDAAPGWGVDDGEEDSW